MANVENFDLLLFLLNTEDDAINIGLTAVKEVPKVGLLRRHRTTVRQILQAENGIFETGIPPGSGTGILGVNPFKESGKVTFGTSGNFNEIGHESLRTR